MHPTTETFLVWARSKTPAASAFLAWCHQRECVKVISTPVPDGILPESICNAILHDIKVEPPRGKGRRTDDYVYKYNDDIRRKVARGNTIFTFNVRSTQESLSCVPIFALRKFTGGFGDEDEDEVINASENKKAKISPKKASSRSNLDLEDSESMDDMHSNIIWRRFFLSPPEDARSVFITAKANGAAAHLTALKVGPQSSTTSENQIESEFVFIGGSKNVHLMFRNPNDFPKYSTDRTAVAIKVCSSIYDIFITRRMNANNLNSSENFFNFLFENGLTACFELLDPADQHVENLIPQLIQDAPSSIDAKTIAANTPWLLPMSLRMYALVSFENGESGKYICEPMSTTFEIAAKYHIPAVNYRILSLDNENDNAAIINDISTNEALNNAIAEIRNEYGHEGGVLYFVDKHNNVIGLLKKKTVWYIIVRGLREKLRGYCKFLVSIPKITTGWENSLEDFAHKRRNLITKRLNEIARWLSLGPEIEAWKELGWKANEWMKEEVKKDVIRTSMTLEKEVNGYFPLLWDRFLKETSFSDKIFAEDPKKIL